MIAFSSSCNGHIDTHIQSESLTENCFREIFKNELRQDVFSFSFIFIFSSSTPSSGSCFTTTSCFHLFFISVLACEAFALDVLRLFFFFLILLKFSDRIRSVLNYDLRKAYRIAVPLQNQKQNHFAHIN